MQKYIVLIVVLGLALWWISGQASKGPDHDFSFSYIVKYSGTASKTDTLPMLLALHGNGDTPENFYASALDQLEVNARIILLQAPVSRGFTRVWPWRKRDLRAYGDAMSKTVDQLLQSYPTVQKPVILGFSGGGMMAYFQSVKYGDRYSYIVPVSGMLTQGHIDNKAFKTGASVLAYHGKQDNVVLLKGGKKAVDILQKNGVDVEFVVFEGTHHGIFSPMKTEITRAVEQKLLSLR